MHTYCNSTLQLECGDNEQFKGLHIYIYIYANFFKNFDLFRLHLNKVDKNAIHLNKVDKNAMHLKNIYSNFFTNFDNDLTFKA
jgi:hypothetical protein